MDAARFIVCEKTGQWSVAIRRAELDLGVRVCETRSLAECWEELAASPASFLALELRAGAVETVLTNLIGLDRGYPAARAAILAPRSQASYEWLLREAGAVHAVFSPRQITSVLRLAKRHLARVPAQERALREMIWARLPWDHPYAGDTSC